uniref:Uncharacterized protein n=1 Tax=Daphnia galeata TaxID=27404 RepID=A0A8J2RGL2_9CRUS|nr:unnamed protein product [Daphnia galeata]
MKNIITIICFLLIGVMVGIIGARPSVYGYGADYGGYGFVDYQGPHYGSGYDKYVFGSYEGHAGHYDYNRILNNYHQGSYKTKDYLQTPYGYGQHYGIY